MIGSPQSVTFHAKFPPGPGNPSYYFSVDFWQSDSCDYNNLTKISSSTCYRYGGYGIVYDDNIPDGNCPEFGFEVDKDKDYTIPIQRSFNFDPNKYYKINFLTYQTTPYFYGSNDESSYIYGKAAKDNGVGSEINASMKDIYFIIKSQSPIEIPANISQSIPQNFKLNYSTSTLTLSLSWDKPRYFNETSPALTYKISDVSYLVSSSTSVLPDIITFATSSEITINEVGRKYKFSIVGYDVNNNPTFTALSKEILIPYSLFSQFVIVQQTDGSVSEIGNSNGIFYQTLGNGLSGAPEAIAVKTSAAGRFITIIIYQYSDANYFNMESFSENAAFCTNIPQHYPGPLCSDYYIGSNIWTVPVKNNFTFAPAKYYKFRFMTYQSQSTFYGSVDENSYLNGQSTKESEVISEIPTSFLRDIYFVILSSTPLNN